MIEINGKKYRNAKEQREHINRCKKLLDLIYDYIAEEEFDKVRSLLSIYGFDSLEELEDIVERWNYFIK